MLSILKCLQNFSWSVRVSCWVLETATCVSLGPSPSMLESPKCFTSLEASFSYVFCFKIVGCFFLKKLLICLKVIEIKNGMQSRWGDCSYIRVWFWCLNDEKLFTEKLHLRHFLEKSLCPVLEFKQQIHIFSLLFFFLFLSPRLFLQRLNVLKTMHTCHN